MSQEESTRFYDQLNHHIFELVSSSDANERKGGILAIGEWKCLMPLVSFLFMHLSLGTDFLKEWAFIIAALWCLTAQYAGCVLLAQLWKCVCKCQHGSCWVLRVAENLVLNGPWALPGVEHQMWVLSMWKFCSWAQVRTVWACPFICVRVGWLSQLSSDWGDWFLLLNLPGSITAASIPGTASHSFCFDFDQLLHQLLRLWFCCGTAELPASWLLGKSTCISTLPSKQVACIVAVNSLITK